MRLCLTVLLRIKICRTATVNIQPPPSNVVLHPVNLVRVCVYIANTITVANVTALTLTFVPSALQLFTV